MYNYRLTKRGKLVISILILIAVCLVNLGIFQISVSAKNEKKMMFGRNINVSTANSSEVKSSSIKNVDNPNLNRIAASNEKKAVEKTNYLKQAEIDKKANNVLTVPVEDAFDGSDKKIAFLTFDDGPSKNVSPQILSILKKYNINATFFVLGKYAEKNKDIIQDIYNDGNAIGYHGYSHIYSVIYGSKNSFEDEINKTDSIVKDILGSGFKTRLFRFPGGSFEKSKDQFKVALKEMNYVYIDWNVVIGDAEEKTPSNNPEALYSRFISTIKNKDHVILLMHDSSTKQETVNILPKVIDYLKSQGYDFAIFK